ncbi:hypothetical protein GCM10023221_30750 [Luteimicrobium xylanilyticum]|uniref:Uncharacterized protein n=1 Tax=Luteimicrobium xylanilyticum TaxID=1133546 RepID=A0A5P9Q5U6_9MICO|nr:hypothetical protein [Luteimicrobium xylanilyticum]QFU96636.1 hypothetical protein KDY119_00120 [Luteimicrobium xylanilyticum]
MLQLDAGEAAVLTLWAIGVIVTVVLVVDARPRPLRALAYLGAAVVVPVLGALLAVTGLRGERRRAAAPRGGRA